MLLTLQDLNLAAADEFVRLLEGVYAHSPWIAERAAARRPFATLAALKRALVEVVREAGCDAQLALIRADPELACQAMARQALTAESSHAQGRAGLADCTPAEFDRLQRLNAEYHARLGFPFILALPGPRGQGLDKAEIVATLERRLNNPPDFERAECLRNIHRIAEIRLADRFGQPPTLGNLVWDWAERLAGHSDPGYAERGELTVSYLGDAHRAVAQRLAHWMRADCGFDEVGIDAVGNVVSLYHAAEPYGQDAPRLLTGSHCDTVRNAGRYDGRLGILVPMACVRELQCASRQLPYAAPSAPAWQQRWERAVAALGLPVHRMPSGAGHDAMKLHAVMPQAMRFQRGLNAGISHNPLEGISDDDTELAVRAMAALLGQLAREHA